MSRLQISIETKTIHTLYQNRAPTLKPVSVNYAMSTLCFIGIFFMKLVEQLITQETPFRNHV